MPGASRSSRALALAAAVVAVVAGLAFGCGVEQRAAVVPHDPPAEVGAMAPNLAVVDGRLAATWLEPASASGASARLRFSRLDAGAWSEPVTIVESSDLFVNWADFPSLVEAGDGRVYAHWLAKTAEGAYAYSIFLARSDDRGATWAHLGQLNSDATPTEHGFVSLVVEDQGARAFWLDGREMPGGGAMALRSARLDGAGGGEAVLDSRVCECCSTDAAVSADGPVVLYRDRSASEVRDVFAIRGAESGWSEPAAVHDDGWSLNGCPVNGPAVAAAGRLVAAAWFTAAGGRSRVQVAFSDDAGGEFGAPITIDQGPVLGRVDVALDRTGRAWLTWMSQRGETAELRVQQATPGGPAGPAKSVASTSAGRASGFPVLETVGDRLFISWVEVAEDRAASRIRVAEL